MEIKNLWELEVNWPAMRAHLLVVFLGGTFQNCHGGELSGAWRSFLGSQWRFFNLKMKNKSDRNKNKIVQKDLESQNTENKSNLHDLQDTEGSKNKLKETLSAKIFDMEKLLDKITTYKQVITKRYVPK